MAVFEKLLQHFSKALKVIGGKVRRLGGEND
jgi:hypothetical protein